VAVSAVWRLVYLLTPCPSEPRSRPQHTGGTRCAPLLEPKSKRLLVLTQIVKKVGTPRRRGPKHQAQRAVSGIQRRLQRERRPATARQSSRRSSRRRIPTYLRRAMAVSAVWRLVLTHTLPIGTKEQTAAHRQCLPLVEPTDRRDPLCPSTKIQKQAAFGIRINRLQKDTA